MIRFQRSFAPKPDESTPRRLGWECPRCHMVLSPDMREHACLPAVKYAPNTGCSACRGGVCGCYRSEHGVQC